MLPDGGRHDSGVTLRGRREALAQRLGATPRTSLPGSAAARAGDSRGFPKTHRCARNPAARARCRGLRGSGTPAVQTPRGTRAPSRFGGRRGVGPQRAALRIPRSSVWFAGGFFERHRGDRPRALCARRLRYVLQTIRRRRRSPKAVRSRRRRHTPCPTLERLGPSPKRRRRVGCGKRSRSAERLRLAALQTRRAIRGGAASPGGAARAQRNVWLSSAL